jgi:hypothetical protein
MKIALPLCLVLACGAMSSEVALAARYHRPNAAAAHSGTATGDAKSPVTATGPAEATTTPSAASGNAGDQAAPIDTSITVNQGHRILTAKEAAAKRLSTELGKLVPTQAKPQHPPAHPLTVHAPVRRNAVGIVVQHADPRTTANRAAAATKAPAPTKSAPQPGPTAAAPATPTPRDVSGTAAPAPKSPAAVAAENNAHSAAVLKTVTANGPSINGTGVARSPTATAAVGGPAKTVAAAAVGGASFRPKHP